MVRTVQNSTNIRDQGQNIQTIRNDIEEEFLEDIDFQPLEDWLVVDQFLILLIVLEVYISHNKFTYNSYIVSKFIIYYSSLISLYKLMILGLMKILL